VTDRLNITVVGAGILGLWQALTLSRAGHAVTLLEQAQAPFSEAASRHAGAMIAPYCEGEAAEDIVVRRGLIAAEAWREALPQLEQRGSLVVASPRDQTELRRFAAATVGYEQIGQDRIAELEPELADRFHAALFFPDEAHMTTPDAMQALVAAIRSAGGSVLFGEAWTPSAENGDADWVIDCRGFAARSDWPELRGVRGERLLLGAPGVSLTRPVRMLHPRHPLYVVPWSGGRYLVGATVIESEDASAMTVRSALELLGLAYTLHPGFGEAEILEMSAGVRPSLPDNVPAVRVAPDHRTIRVNGAYRHGFLLAPELARAVSEYLGTGASDDPFVAIT
jgi:glycine oxidase